MWGFLLAAALNAVIAAQMVLYWNNSSAGGGREVNLGSGSTSSEREKLREVEERSVGVPPSPTVSSGAGIGGAVPPKKWARKVD